MLDYRNWSFAPVALSVIFIAVLAVYYFLLLPVGHIQHGDEYLTLDRAYSFVIRDDFFSVYSNNLPTFKKPPLQYWITALLLRKGVDLEFALRFPAFLFGMLTLINVGVLAYLIYPASRWVAPAAIALLAGSASFWDSNISALLDSGAMFFATLGLTGCLAAFRQPKWWYLVALACGLAALQKAPIPLLFVGGVILVMIATKRYHRLDLNVTFRNRHFWIAMGLTVVTVLFWPALQWIRFGPASFHEAYVSQMADRFSPFGTANTVRNRSWLTVLLGGEAQLRIPAILALLALPWVLRRTDLLALPLLFVAFAVMTIFATGYLSPRYSLIFLPLLAAALAAVLIRAATSIESGIGTALVVLVIAALALSRGGPIRNAKALGLLKNGQEKYIPLLKGIAKSLRSDETFLVCRSGAVNDRIMAGAISYYASNGHPFYEVRSADSLEALKQASLHPPFRGLCRNKVFQELKSALGSYEIVEEFNGYVHWTAR